MPGAVLASLIKASGPLTVAATPDFITGFRNETGTVESFSNSNAVVSGGRGPYTYSWTRVSGSTSILPYSSTAASTGFFSFFTSFETRTAVYKVTVTDADSTVVDSNNITVELTCGLIRA